MTKVWKVAVVFCLALVTSQLAAAATQATNGNVLAFTSLRGGNAAIYVSKPDGSGAHRLTPAGSGPIRAISPGHPTEPESSTRAATLSCVSRRQTAQTPRA